MEGFLDSERERGRCRVLSGREWRGLNCTGGLCGDKEEAGAGWVVDGIGGVVGRLDDLRSARGRLSGFWDGGGTVGVRGWYCEGL